jgi:hypothetical protein
MPADVDPNLWGLQREDARTLITLGTAVLGVSATFGKSFLAPSGSASPALLGAWAAIALSILAAIFASATVFNRLKANADLDASAKTDEEKKSQKKKPGGSASFCLNASFFLLVGGLVTLALVASQNWNASPSPSTTYAQSVTAAEKAVAAAQATKPSQLRVQRFTRLNGSDASVVICDPAAKTTYAVLVDTSDDQIIDLRATP